MLIKKLKELYNQRENGFTLVELMVTVLIIGILAAIAIPVFLNLQTEAAKAQVESDVKNSVTQAQLALTSSGMGELDADSEDNEGTIDIIRYDHLGNPVTTTTVHKVVASDGTNLTIERDPAGGGLDYVVTGTHEGVDDWAYTFTSRTGEYSASAAPSAGGPSTGEEETPTWGGETTIEAAKDGVEAYLRAAAAQVDAAIAANGGTYNDLAVGIHPAHPVYNDINVIYIDGSPTSYSIPAVPGDWDAMARSFTNYSSTPGYIDYAIGATSGFGNVYGEFYKEHPAGSNTVYLPGGNEVRPG